MIKKVLLLTLLTIALCQTAYAENGSIVKGVNSYSNATVSDLYKVTKGTRMEGYEQTILDTESTYGVNALFIIAVAQTETSMGLAGVGRAHKNNLFGMTGNGGFISYESPGDSIQAFGKLINTRYFAKGRYSLGQIGAVYAADSNWALKVESNINNVYNKMTM